MRNYKIRQVFLLLCGCFLHLMFSRQVTAEITTSKPEKPSEDTTALLSPTSPLLPSSSDVDPGSTEILSPTLHPSESIVPSSSVQPSSTSAKPSSASPKPTSSAITPKSVVVYKCGAECKALTKRLWAAGFFAVLFAVTTILFVVLLCRQYKISREDNDPAMARLI